jgi:hypothetical protein
MIAQQLSFKMVAQLEGKATYCQIMQYYEKLGKTTACQYDQISNKKTISMEVWYVNIIFASDNQTVAKFLWLY